MLTEPIRPLAERRHWSIRFSGLRGMTIPQAGRYHLHSESKFYNGELFNRGITERLHVEVVDVEYIGKEANRWEEQYFLGEAPEAQIEYVGILAAKSGSLRRWMTRSGSSAGAESPAKRAFHANNCILFILKRRLQSGVP